MALATRPRPNVHHKKRRAQHHRHSRLYLKPYWPYLPMLAIMGTGVVVNRLWSGGIPGVKTALTLNPQFAAGAPPVARIQVLTGSQVTWIVALVSVIAVTALALFVIRDWYRLHRLINKGEAFIYRRPWFDVAMVFVFTAGFVLTSTSGIIR